MSGVNERLCTNKSFKIGLSRRMGRKGKLRISFVSPLPVSLPPSPHVFHFTCRYLKRRGERRWFAEKRPALVSIKRSVLHCPGAHRLVCLLIMREGCSSNECGKVLSGQYVPPSPPHRRRHHHWTTLDCLEAIWNKGSAPLCCGGPACGLCAPSGANI